jgi:hypothetical protein
MNVLPGIWKRAAVPLLNSLVSFGSLAIVLVFVFGFVSVFAYT